MKMAKKDDTLWKRSRKSIVGQIQELEVRLPQRQIQEVKQVRESVVLETEHTEMRKERQSLHCSPELEPLENYAGDLAVAAGDAKPGPRAGIGVPGP